MQYNYLRTLYPAYLLHRRRRCIAGRRCVCCPVRASMANSFIFGEAPYSSPSTTMGLHCICEWWAVSTSPAWYSQIAFSRDTLAVSICVSEEYWIHSSEPLYFGHPSYDLSADWQAQHNISRPADNLLMVCIVFLWRLSTGHPYRNKRNVRHLSVCMPRGGHPPGLLSPSCHPAIPHGALLCRRCRRIAG